MAILSEKQNVHRPVSAWLTCAVSGAIAPVVAFLLLLDRSDPASLVSVGGPAIAVGLMGAGMIGAAAAGRFRIGLALSVASGLALVLTAFFLGTLTLSNTFVTGVAILASAISFAARGALFWRSSGAKGWWIAVFVVAGEAAIVLTAAMEPDVLPSWLLALLPAQWANIAIQTGLSGGELSAAAIALAALIATAAATHLVARLWPRRWPYLIMFTTWLALSALVHQHYY